MNHTERKEQTTHSAETVRAWDGLNQSYGAIVVDPPWQYETIGMGGKRRRIGGGGQSVPASHGIGPGTWFAYSQMTLAEIKALPVGDLTTDGRCFLWTTNRYLRHSWDVLESWGFTPQERIFVWCKPLPMLTPVTTEYILVGRKGKPPRLPWCDTTWFNWGRPKAHSAKPDAFMDLVESWCPGPYVELFSRSPRLGWDSWGKGYELALPEPESGKDEVGLIIGRDVAS